MPPLPAPPPVPWNKPRSVPRVVRYIIVHHAEAYDSKRRKPVFQRMETVRAIHTRSVALGGRGFIDIAYHRYVEGDGKLRFGRPESQVGAHCHGFNENTLGICGAGHGDFEPFNPEQLATIVQQCAAWCFAHQLGAEKVLGHRETDDYGGPPVLKTCPGMLNDMGQLRQLVARAMQP